MVSFARFERGSSVGRADFDSPVAVVQAGDYIGLGLLEPLETSWIPKLRLHVVLEDSDLVMGALRVDVSVDGMRWVSRFSRRICICS